MKSRTQSAHRTIASVMTALLTGTWSVPPDARILGIETNCNQIGVEIEATSASTATSYYPVSPTSVTRSTKRPGTAATSAAVPTGTAVSASATFELADHPAVRMDLVMSTSAWTPSAAPVTGTATSRSAGREHGR